LEEKDVKGKRRLRLSEHPSRGYKLREFFNVPTTARSTPQVSDRLRGGINFRYSPQADVKEGALFLLLLLGKQKKEDYKKLLPPSIVAEANYSSSCQSL
jgi:hypothetical protein